MLTAGPRGAIVPRRAIGVNLVLFFAFALIALLFLTRTVVSAVQIDANVGEAVKPAVGSIQENTALLPALDRTVALTSQIETSSNAIGADTSAVTNATDHINSMMAVIYQDVQTIGTAVVSIDSSVASIRLGVNSVDQIVASIGSQSADISSRYRSVADDISGVPAGISSASSSLTQTRALIGPINGTTGGIDSTLVTINGHVVNIANNPLLQLSSLLGLTNLLGL